MAVSEPIRRLIADFDARRPAALARAVSIVENHRSGFDELLATLHPRLGRARRIGLTGPPGAGKSTLTTCLTSAYRAAGLTVGVVAVDPTSPFTGGALLGDRIRMESVALDPGVFIRSMATRGSLGGLAAATREVADVLDAFGFDRILIETVGVGQSELDIARTRGHERRRARPGVGRLDPDAQGGPHGDRGRVRRQQGGPPRRRPAAQRGAS